MPAVLRPARRLSQHGERGREWHQSTGKLARAPKPSWPGRRSPLGQGAEALLARAGSWGGLAGSGWPGHCRRNLNTGS